MTPADDLLRSFMQEAILEGKGARGEGVPPPFQPAQERERDP